MTEVIGELRSGPWFGLALSPSLITRIWIAVAALLLVLLPVRVFVAEELDAGIRVPPTGSSDHFDMGEINSVSQPTISNLDSTLGSEAATVAPALTVIDSQPVSAGARWTVDQVAGTVWYKSPAAEWYDWWPLAEGTSLAPGSDVITTTGQVTLSFNDDRITMQPRSQITLQESESGLVKIFQHLGVVLFDVDHRPGLDFQVETPYLLAGVKGTSFEIEVSTKGATVKVADGTVWVGHPSDSGISAPTVTVNPGEVVTVKSSQRPDLIVMPGSRPLSVPALSPSSAGSAPGRVNPPVPGPIDPPAPQSAAPEVAESRPGTGRP